jgi:pimeloyl-ACP methyl ester carboxylesterase
VQEGERAPAWLFLPHGIHRPRPAILCLHQTVPQGKDEPAGISGKRSLAFAAHYARLGYVTLAPDSITAGERVYPGTEPYETAPFYERNPRWSAMGKMIWDHMRALDYLCSLEQVDPRRLGCIGHSLGGYNAFFLAAYDERVAACVASCAFTPLVADDNPMRWARETWFCHMPRLRPYIEKRRFPFDFEHVFALIAPRALLVVTGLRDDIFGNTERCGDSMAAAAKVYSLLGARDRISHFVHPHGHAITLPGLSKASSSFSRWLAR